MQNSQKNNRILVDTCVLTRLFDTQNKIVFTYFNDLMANKKELCITDKTLYELLSKQSNNLENMAKLRHILLIYKFRIIHMVDSDLPSSSRVDNLYHKWLLGENVKTELEFILYESYIYTITRFYANLATQIIVCLDYSLNKARNLQFKSPFFHQQFHEEFIVADLFNPDIIGLICNEFLYEKILAYLTENSFPEKKIKDTFNNALTEFFNSIITLFEMKDFEGNNFLDEYRKCLKEKNAKNKKIGDLCKEYIKATTDLSVSKNVSETDTLFIIKENKRIIGGYSSFYNDIVDYINFKYARKFCKYLFSYDHDLFEDLLTVFSEDDNIIEFINSSKQFSEERKI